MVSQCYRALRNPLNRVLSPEHYSKSAAETIALTLAGSWIVTLIFNPDVADSNPLRDRMGYNNLCVGLDTAPAKFVALPGLVLTSYFGICYTFSDTQRCELEKERLTSGQYLFTWIANGMYGVFMLYLPGQCPLCNNESKTMASDFTFQVFYLSHQMWK